MHYPGFFVLIFQLKSTKAKSKQKGTTLSDHSLSLYNSKL